MCNEINVTSQIFGEYEENKKSVLEISDVVHPENTIQPKFKTKK